MYVSSDTHLINDIIDTLCIIWDWMYYNNNLYVRTVPTTPIYYPLLAILLRVTNNVMYGHVSLLTVTILTWSPRSHYRSK